MSLVITRREGNKIWIGDACITVDKIRGKQVRIHIEAKKDVKILRGELKDAPPVRSRYTWHKKETRSSIPK